MASRDPFPDLYFHYFDKFNLILNSLKNSFTLYATNYFNQNNTAQSHDQFFGRFGPIWTDLLRQRKYTQAMKLWDFALELAHNWEKKNRPNKVHKGTPYYFLGVAAILNNDLENGFLAMHQALKEDYRLSSGVVPQTPAYWFVSLDSTHMQQYFVQKVQEITDFLFQKLQNYRTQRSGTLQFIDFRNRFLRCRKLTNEAFYFVYLLFNLKKLESETHTFKRNPFSSIIYINFLFNLCRTLERLVGNKNSGSSGTGFKDEVVFLSRTSTGISSMSFTDRQLRRINGRYKSDFNKTMYDILLGRYLSHRTQNERDFAISYGLRNKGAHELGNFKVIYNRFPELAQIVLNAFFFTVEKLY